MIKKKIKIIITGGGTGGHIIPLMAVANKLRKNNVDILYIGSGLEIEKKAAKAENIKYKSVLSGKFKRYFAFSNFVTPFKVIIGIIQSVFVLFANWPDVIFAKGGYPTFPVVFAGWILKRPIVIHESDVVMGLANRWEARFAKKICVGFPVENYKNVPLSKIIYTGNPIRDEFILKDNFKKFEDKKELPVILVTGGSQGARFINQVVASILKYLTLKYHIVHISGKNDYEWLSQNRWKNYELYAYTEYLPKIMARADLVISRAGANTLAEISALAKPSILIPLPESANEHQWANAKIYEKNNAAVVVSEKKLSPDNLKIIIDHLMKDDKLRIDIAKNAQNLSQPDSAAAIAKIIMEVAKKKENV